MKNFRKVLVASSILFWAVAGAAQAHVVAEAPAAVDAQIAVAASRIYKLADESTYQHGCLPPCLCPTEPAYPVRGTFKLTSAGQEEGFAIYNIADVNWFVATYDGELRITGSGVYRVSQVIDCIHQLELDLVVDDGEVTHYDSGLVIGGSEFPDISIRIAMNDFFCLDTVITVNASPVPANQIRPYCLIRGSTYQHGCWPPCLCPLFAEQDMVGSFGLVYLQSDPLFTEYAVVNVRWRVLPYNAYGEIFPITGFGIYRVGGEVAPLQQMMLGLSVDGNDLTHFDSGLVSGGSSLRLIDIVLSVNGMFCYDQVVHVRAVPRKPYAITPSATAVEAQPGSITSDALELH
ncbi:MAG: hypothetical protein KAV82_03915 [Phycisphaerae bacterium]|nr:hypothetical protein [Phycisphaerae bacterium]